MRAFQRRIHFFDIWKIRWEMKLDAVRWCLVWLYSGCLWVTVRLFRETEVIHVPYQSDKMFWFFLWLNDVICYFNILANINYDLINLFISSTSSIKISPYYSRSNIRWAKFSFLMWDILSFLWLVLHDYMPICMWCLIDIMGRNKILT